MSNYAPRRLLALSLISSALCGCRQPQDEGASLVRAEPLPTEVAPLASAPEPPRPLNSLPPATAPEPPAEDQLTTLLGRAQAALDARRGADAAAFARQALTLDDRDPRPHLLLGQALRLSRQHDPALMAFTQGLTRSPQGAVLEDLLYGQAVCALELNRASLAVEALERLSGFRPDDPTVQRLLGAAKDRAGQDGLGAYEAAAKARSGDAQAQADLGSALARKGRYTDAIGALEAAALAAPKDAELKLKLGTALGLAGRLPEAEAALSQAARLSPQTVDTWRSLAVVREQRGDAEGAARAYESMLSYRPSADPDGRLRQRIQDLRAGGLEPAKPAHGGP